MERSGIGCLVAARRPTPTYPGLTGVAGARSRPNSEGVKTKTENSHERTKSKYATRL